ncbi:MAG: hypothetical protein JWM74_3053 [Myxococcaceae bacterium]|nr:hypothetical protein [Myxococcaceae bacterium]
MREYRDELEAAQRRIATLESELAEKKGARVKLRSRRTVVMMVIAANVVVAIAIGVAFGIRWNHVLHPVAVPAPVIVEQRPGPARTGRDVQWIPLFWNGPITEDVDGDGVDDIVGLFWDDARPDHGAYVVAVSGLDHKRVLWARGPFVSVRDPRHMWLTQEGNTVVFVDGAGTIRAFAPHDGASRGEWTDDLPVQEVCPLPGGSRVYLQSVAFNHGRMLDLEKATLTPADKQDATYGCHGRDDVPSCADLSAPRPICHPRTAMLGKTLKQAYESYEDGPAGEIVTVGWSPTDNNAPYFGVGAHRPGTGGGASAGPYEVAWEKRLSLPEEAGRERNFRYAFAKGRLLLAYQTPLGPYRVVARDARTGEVAWNHVLGGTAEASTLESIKGAGGRVYVVVDGRVVVFDGESGDVVTAALQIVTLPD